MVWRLALGMVLMASFLACQQDEQPLGSRPDGVKESTAQDPPSLSDFSIPKILETTPSGLQYHVEKAGTGAVPAIGRLVAVHYTGWLLDGTRFDGSRDRGAPIVFPVGKGQVIKGWDEGIGMMKEGEVRTLVVPPELGYGGRGAPPMIPPYATLVFRVELLEVR